MDNMKLFADTQNRPAGAEKQTAQFRVTDVRPLSHSDEIPEICPLTDIQLGIYLDCKDKPEAVNYNIPVKCSLPRGTDQARFIEAVKTVANKHRVLCVTIGAPDGVPSMIYHGGETAVEELQVEHLASVESKVRRLFDLEKGPLYHFEYIASPEGDVFFFDVHHIIFDGSSIGVMLEQIVHVYNGGECPEEQLTQFDVSRAGENAGNPEKEEEYRRFFEERLGGIDCDSKPVPDQTVKNDEEVCEFLSVKIGDRLSAETVAEYIEKHGISENALFLGAFSYTLAKWNGTAESVVTTAYHGRFDPRFSSSVGMFVRTLPFPCSFDETMTPADFLTGVYNDYYRIKKNDCIPFAELASQYGIGMDVSFIYQAELFQDVAMEDGAISIEILPQGTAVSNLEIMVMKTANGYQVDCYYLCADYTEAFARGFLDLYVNVLCGMMQASSLKEIGLTDEKSKALLDRFNETEQPYETEKTVVDLFREQARRTPDVDCLVYENRHFTYREIDALTDRFAKHLRTLGIGKGSVVGVLIPRCEYMLIASLGVLKACGAYLPLDPSYPPERLNLMMADSGASMLLTTPELSGIIDETFSGIRMMVDAIPALEDTEVELPTPDREDLFVMLYTSGSTGKPKGVLFAHSNTMVTAAWQRDFYELGVGSNVTAYASYGFDANVFDTYAAVTSGATLHIISDAIRLDLLALQRYFNTNNITHSTMTTQVGRQFAEMGGADSLRCLNVAGEKLTPLKPPQGFKLYNLYGPTEGSILVSSFLVDKLYKDIPIGSAIDNVKLYVVDAFGRLLPPGAVGELWLSGAHVTKGYLNRPEKNAEAYGKNPFCTDSGYESVFRTGDIVRMMHDGNLQFIGRRDGQVKVRGFRVELTEVEEIIRRFDGIKDATLAAFDDPSGGKFIAAYVVSDDEIDIDALNTFIRSEKPPYMVPAVTMQIDAIPLTQNQKVNKRALPKPERKINNIVPPQNQMQQKIYEITAEVIGHNAFGIDTDLFDAGLTSIGTLKLNVMLGSAFDAAVKLEDIKQNPTVQALESMLLSCRKEETYARREDYPLTQTQMGIYIECSVNPYSVLYNIPLFLKLGSGVDPEKLAAAIKTALNAHPYVKTTLFADENGEIRARRNDEAEPLVDRLACETLEPDKLVAPFLLLSGPLYRVRIIQTGSGNYLFMDFHHIIFDGTSETILLSDIEKAYAGLAVEHENYTGFEAALEEEAARRSEHYNEARAHYDRIFTDCETDCLPPKAPENDSPEAASIRRIGTADADAVQSYCSRNKLTLNAFFNAAFGFALSRFGQLEDVVYTTVYNGRSDSRLASSVTMLVKTLPVLLHTGADRAVVELIRETQEQLMGSMTNDLYSFAEISGAYGIRADLIFVYQGDAFSFEKLCGEPAERIDVQPVVAKAPITVSVYLRNGKFEIEAAYRQDFYNAAFMNSFLDVFDLTIQGFYEEERTGGIVLLSETADRKLTEINDTQREFENLPVNQFVERYAATDPERMAVIGSGKRLTYGELNRLANRMAHALVALGAKTGSVVGMILDRTVELSAAELAILKAGGAFLGLLPGYPDERIEYCLRDAESSIVITSEEIKATRPELLGQNRFCRVVTINELLQNENEENLNLDIAPDSLAYCIYTSGTTGKPKGVMIEHRNLACCAQPADFVYSLYFGETSGQTGLALSSISFDMSIMDNLMLLMCGKTACIAAEREIHNPMELAKQMLENRVELVVATPSFLTNALSIPEFRSAMKQVRTLVSGAESFPKALYHELRTLSPEMHILNGYGPSECTITCCAKELCDSENITIGGPTANTAFYIVDRFGNILPPYACGELIICGALVGRGYMKLPEKTNAVFFTLRGMPAYRSGDVARLNADGEVEFFGRKDNQVKLRGFRVELDEIEKGIASYDGVTQSKVIVRNNGSEDFLAAFFTANHEIEIEQLRTYLKSRLAYYMVPDAMMQLDAMPLTMNGKIDKKALPEIKRESRKAGKRAPKKSLEEQLCDLFRSVLSLEECYADDNFFELGGTSLSASKVTMQLMSQGFRVEYQDIFSNPTPELLAGYIESQKTVSAESKKEETAGEETGIQELLKYNTLECAAEVSREPLGDVLLTGAAGFLGIHVLKELIERKEGKIFCLVRQSDAISPEDRLKNMLMYYFDSIFEEAFAEQISVLNADITDDTLQAVLAPVHYDTLINCAACVKHYASDDQIERVNVHGVENLIRSVREKNARMIQISTVSVPGVHTAETWKKQVKMHENELFVIDDMNNKYGISKYQAELKMLQAMQDGMRGKIIRVGNLMGRYTDGEFQINFNTNAFLNALRGFATIGKCPISHATDPMKFSPIDMTAKAIVLLAGTNDRFTAFHADNRFGFDEMQLIEAANQCGIRIVPVSDEEYYADYRRMLGNEKVNAKLQGLVTNDRPDLHAVDTDNVFTANILYRLGFSWPLMDGAYLERAIRSLMTLDYFESDDEERV